MVTIPNILSALRIIIAPFLLYFAWHDNPLPFLVLFIIALLSDTFDGYLARKLDQISELGGKLDSWGDFVIYLTVPICAWWLWPELIIQEIVFVIIAVASFVVPILAGFFKYGRLTSYHTWGAKIAAVLIGISTPLLFIGGPAWLFRLSTVFFVLVELEEISITVMLPEWRANVPSLWHALKINKSVFGRDVKK